MEIIDCHANLGWDMNNIRRNQHPNGQNRRQLLVKMNNAQVGRAIIVPFPSPGGQFSAGSFWYDVENHNLINAVNANSRLVAFPGVNPKDPASVRAINTFALAYGIKGVKFSHQIPMEFSIDKLIKHPLMNIIEENYLIMMMHIGTGKEKGAELIHTTLPYAIKVAKYYPNVRFIFCHLGRLHEDIIEALHLPNVWMDTAGFSLGYQWADFAAKDYLKFFKSLQPEQIIEHLVRQGFEEKILFGSDEPYTSYKKEIGIIRKANISEIAKRKILGRNLSVLLG
jgi:predicted TIM-barrel fold metal-dependent hydrolase